MNTTLLLLAEAGFIVLTTIYLGLTIKEFYRGIQHTGWALPKKRRSIIMLTSSLLLWMIFVSVWSASGIMSDFSRFPFNFLPVLAVPLITSIVLTLFSRDLYHILRHIPAESLVRLQSFRFFVEILLWMLFVAGAVPEQMTFEGRNFDILAGITAPLIAWLMVRRNLSKTGAILWNIVCLGLLVNIVTVAILSTPSPLRVFMNEPANTIVTYFPVSWLPGFLVPLAYSLHFFSLKQLLTKK